MAVGYQNFHFLDNFFVDFIRHMFPYRWKYLILIDKNVQLFAADYKLTQFF